MFASRSPGTGFSPTSGFGALVASSTSTPTAAGAESPKNASQRSASVTLSCLSADGRYVHSLVTENGSPVVESRSLPLPDGIEQPTTEQHTHVRTALDTIVRDALQRYEAIELLCVDVAGRGGTESTGRLHASLLCLYTKRDLFVLDLVIRQDASGRSQGTLVSVSEPFEHILLHGNPSARIVRVRQAPQRRDGFAVMCPRGSMALLLLDPTTNAHTLYMYNGRDTSVETALTFGTEQLDGPSERVVDFCFCRSSPSDLSLLSSLTVLFLKASADVIVATPVLFPETVVSKHSVDTVRSFIDSHLQRTSQGSPQWRRLRAAHAYVSDIFVDDGTSTFVTTRARTEAASWPVRVQGPVLIAPEDDDFAPVASAIECLPATSDFIGVAIANKDDSIDFGVLAPTVCVPRFALESQQDSEVLDSQLTPGTIVQRIEWSDKDAAYPTAHDVVALVPDPVVDTDVHYVTRTFIRTVSTNIFQIVQQDIQMQEAENDPSHTATHHQQRKKATAWSLVDVNATDPSMSQRVGIIGVTVSGNVGFGHTLMCQLSNGTCFPVNVTESRHFNEIESAEASNEGAKGMMTGPDQSTTEMGGSEPLYALIEPLASKVVDGMNRMTRIVGSSTPQEDVTLPLLAVANDVKRRCNEEVMLPLIEMNQLIRQRKKELTVVHRAQAEQLQTLLEIVKRLREQDAEIRSKAAKLEENANSLSARSASVLQTMELHKPTITEAEYDYFNFIRQSNRKCEQWTRDVSELERECELEQPRKAAALELPAETVVGLRKVQLGTGKILRDHQAKLATLSKSIHESMSALGRGNDDDDISKYDG